ncbi:MAG: glycosyltransferase family 2 protein [Firmicutes bacterium]|nr:glycosyltransferase family 2 protein [Bacillota bacterium]
MNAIFTLNMVISILFVVLYFYQYVYIVVGAFGRQKKFPEGKRNRFAVLIAARNEERVIAHLIDSVRAQDYPSELIDIYVVADNCTDSTADIACAHGAAVYERQNAQKIGKGYALDFLMKKIFASKGREYYDGYFVFDADNLLDERYITEMNKVFSSGYDIVTSFRSSKNYGSGWIASGYALWFVREAVSLNAARMKLGVSCAVSGTGFMFGKKTALRNDGWKFYLLTEDIEFTADSILSGDKIGYCENAVFYDEQPETFIQSWNQRLRWARGYLQVLGKYGVRLLRGIIKEKSFSCFDMIMNIMPAMTLSVAACAANSASIIISFFVGSMTPADTIISLSQMVWHAYLLLFAVGVIAGVVGRRKIICPVAKRILYSFTFPIFMFTYIPITIASFFVKCKWTPIRHTDAVSIEQLRHRKTA